MATWLRWCGVLCAALLWAGGAWADVGPQLASDAPASGTNGCQKYLMCNAQTSTGDCTRAGDEIVARLFGRYTVTFYGTQSTATTYSCDIVSNDEGHDEASGSGYTVNTSSLTNSAEVLSLEGLFDYVWVNCSSISGGGAAVTVTMLACPLAR